MNWNTMGRQCYICLSAIVNHLLKQKLTPDREAQLEASLGTFYAPTRPLLDTTVLEYRDPISRYARRFFHHLLRYQRFEKAFLLAVDIGARDLFMVSPFCCQDVSCQLLCTFKRICVVCSLRQILKIELFYLVCPLPS
uniref:Uncharacterized protein n=1 Tax=Cairina moschata TaxID=8855 RepID=A0A8C3C867_CAIMO